jgi:hypothetical protein
MLRYLAWLTWSRTVVGCGQGSWQGVPFYRLYREVQGYGRHSVRSTIKGRRRDQQMAGKIFYRERIKVSEDKKQPRFKLVAVADVNLKVYGKHLRRSELEQIASAVGAELILLTHGDKKYKDETVEIKD